MEGTDAKLEAIVERIEALEEEKAGIAQDIKDVYAEAKIEGFDVKILRRIISLRKLEPQEREEQESLLEVGGSNPLASTIQRIRGRSTVSVGRFFFWFNL